MSSNNGETIRSALAAAALGLFGWHLLTLHNIAKSVEVLIEKVGNSTARIERLENKVFFSDDGKEQIR
jgi:hypothetical protein